MGNYGIKIGDNIQTDSDLDLQFSSEFSSLKFYKWGNAQFTTDDMGFTYGVEIEHGLNYTPVFFVFHKTTAQYEFLSATSYQNAYIPITNTTINSYDNVGGALICNADNNKIYIKTFIGGTPFSGGISPNTTYYFRYYILVDKSESFSSASNVNLTGDYGFKTSLPGKDVLTAEEYDMAYSSKYKALQFYDNHILSSSLTLPAMWATYADSEVESATYVDFNHNLGYPPFFLAYADIEYPSLSLSGFGEIPYFLTTDGEVIGPDVWKLSYEEISTWSDSSRVRVLFKRQSDIPVIDGTSNSAFEAETINIKVIIFAEDLSGLESP